MFFVYLIGGYPRFRLKYSSDWIQFQEEFQEDDELSILFINVEQKIGRPHYVNIKYGYNVDDQRSVQNL